ncbi:DNA-processing protein DprA [Oceanospirillum sanctuarii]|uniref:DNA-processing protein DprA n=1 Tax=Oceanospirillum sanctuarii TaxID=1434821 RepID=UPI000A3D1831|nr:DNA-processing protein DprA [Oceanospirillum sanctuarii]
MSAETPATDLSDVPNTSSSRNSSNSTDQLLTSLRFLALSSIKGLGPVGVQELLAFADQEGVVPKEEAFWSLVLNALNGQKRLSPQELQSFERRISDPFNDSLSSQWPERDTVLEWLQANPSRQLLALGQENYPYLLAEISDPPLLLYLQGDAELLHRPQLAIVGARRPTAMGLSDARAFAGALTELGWTITSGLAEGIDAAAHQGALQAKGKTLAVLGTGLDRCYPAHHKSLQQAVAAAGLLVSEYPLGTPPRGPNFPRRNRIVSGLSVGLLVVEAALKSGSLISARLASEQGREVFAIPGSIHQAQSKGCHQLIKQGAKLTETVMDMHEELSHWLQNAAPMPVYPADSEQTSYAVVGPQTSLFSKQSASGSNRKQLADRSPEEFTSPEAYQIWQAVKAGAGNLDELVLRCQLEASLISQHCLMLEMQGLLKQQAGRWQVS